MVILTIVAWVILLGTLYLGIGAAVYETLEAVGQTDERHKAKVIGLWPLVCTLISIILMSLMAGRFHRAVRTFLT